MGVRNVEGKVDGGWDGRVRVREVHVRLVKTRSYLHETVEHEAASLINPLPLRR